MGLRASDTAAPCALCCSQAKCPRALVTACHGLLLARAARAGVSALLPGHGAVQSPWHRSRDGFGALELRAVGLAQLEALSNALPAVQGVWQCHAGRGTGSLRGLCRSKCSLPSAQVVFPVLGICSP